MRRGVQLTVACLAVLVTTAGYVQADPVLFTNRAAWETAAGMPTISQDFTGVAANQNLATPFDFGAFTIQAFELDGPESGLNAGGDWALFAVESANNPETVGVTFDEAITAIGLDMFLVNASIVDREVVVTTTDGVISYFTPATTNTSEFRGIVFMTPVTELTFSSPTGGAGHRVTQIDAVTAPVPEPSSIAIFGISGVAMGFVAVRRRRRERPSAAA